MEEVVRHTCRLHPGAQAERALLAEWHRCRRNEAVHQEKSGNKPTLVKLGKLLTEARRRCGWLREGSQVAQQQTLRTYARALTHSFEVEGRGRPTLKHRKDTRPSLEYTTRGFSSTDRRLILPKGISIPVIWSRELPSEPRSVRLYQDSLGDWHASFVVRCTVDPLPETTGGIGIDWGVSTIATATDPGHDQPHLGHRARCSAEVAKAQRTMARRERKKGVAPSKGYLRAKRESARLQKKAARQHAHNARQWARAVVETHQLVAIEDFHPEFLAKTTMARKAADAAVGATKRVLVEYGVRAGRKVVLVRPAHTTMTCGDCFARAKQRLPLAERTFRCQTCGHTADRDRNAAGMILAVAERGHTRIKDGSHWYPPDAGAV